MTSLNPWGIDMGSLKYRGMALEQLIESRTKLRIALDQLIQTNSVLYTLRTSIQEAQGVLDDLDAEIRYRKGG